MRLPGRGMGRAVVRGQPAQLILRLVDLSIGQKLAQSWFGFVQALNFCRRQRVYGPQQRHVAVKGRGCRQSGRQGRSGLSRLIYGSVAEAVLRGAHRPVMIMPSHSALAHGMIGMNTAVIAQE